MGFRLLLILFPKKFEVSLLIKIFGRKRICNTLTGHNSQSIIVTWTVLSITGQGFNRIFFWQKAPHQVQKAQEQRRNYINVATFWGVYFVFSFLLHFYYKIFDPKCAGWLRGAVGWQLCEHNDLIYIHATLRTTIYSPIGDNLFLDH